MEPRDCDPISDYSPVTVIKPVDWERDYSALECRHLLACDHRELAAIDPLASNLTVAKGIDTLAHLEVAEYQHALNCWAADFRDRYLPDLEQHFHASSAEFRNDIRYFRLGLLHQYLDCEIGIEYREDQRDLNRVRYTDPSDLFLNGVIETRQGTCGNMAALHVAIAWRLGWPVSLACINSHFICRFDDGEVVHNLEATDTGRGGWSSRTDQRYVDETDISPHAIRVGSDLRALTPHEMLAVFIGLRARHTQDLGKSKQDEALMLASESDWLLARSLFPHNRLLYRQQMAASAIRGDIVFSQRELGHPLSFARYVNQQYQVAKPPTTTDLLFSQGALK